jgi:hypothetical protein
LQKRFFDEFDEEFMGELPRATGATLEILGGAGREPKVME